MIEDLLRAAAEAPAPDAPADLKARLYSALIIEERAEAPLRPLAQSKQAGEQLCVFEELVAILPSNDLQSRNPCAVCHARVLGENFEKPPIFWHGCPYVAFCRGQK
jgi:hypothetical protein